MKFHQNPRVISRGPNRKQRTRAPSEIPPTRRPGHAEVPPTEWRVAPPAMPQDPWREIRLGGMVLMVIALIASLTS